MELYQYIQNGDMSAVQKYIEENGTPVDSMNTDYLIVRYALWRGQREITKFLIEKGCRVNIAKPSKSTPLHIAIEQKDVEMIKILLAKGAIVEQIDSKLLASLHLAIHMKEYDIVDLILTNLGDMSNHSSSINRLCSLHTAMLKDESHGIRKMFKSRQAIKIYINDPVISTVEYWHTYRSYNVEVLPDRGADVNTNDSTPLHSALFIKKLNSIDLILERRILFKNNSSVDNTGLSHFHIACMRNESHAVKSFIAIGVKINSTISATSPYWPGYSPLHFAIEHHCLSTVELLLSSNADVNLKNSEGLTPLHMAVKNNQIDAAKLLLEHGANINIQDLNNCSPLHLALQLKHLSIMDLILEYNKLSYSINPVDNRGISHFHIACIRNYHHVAEGFLKNGIDINSPIMTDNKQWPGYTALHLAITFHRTETVKTLISYDANVSIQNGKGLTSVNSKNNKGLTPLHIAIKNNRIDIVRLLLIHGANINIQDLNNYSPLHLALQLDNVAIMNLIFEEYKKLSYSINPVDNRGISHFHIACIRNYSHVVEGFLNNGVDINSPIMANDKQWPGYTALHLAVKFCNTETVKTLINYDASVSIQDRKGLTSVNSKNSEGSTPLHIAVNHNQLDDVRLLLEYGANINIQDLDNRSPLHLALQLDNKAIMNLILQEFKLISSYSINPVNNRGISHFHIACIRNYSHVVEGFLINGVDINSPVMTNDKHWPGYTALHLAVEFRCIETVKMLLSYCADVSIQDARGLTPLSYNSQNENIGYLILNHSICKNINPKNRYGYSYFHQACREYPNAVEAFLRIGVDVNESINDDFTGNYKCTALHLAIESGCERTVQLLLSYGANVNARNSHGYTPLHLICDGIFFIFNAFSPSKEMLNILLNNGANVHMEVPQKPGFSLLHMAVVNRFYESFEILVKNNIDINCVEFNNLATPLHLAIFFKHFDIIDTLLELGADTNARDKHGRTCLHKLCLLIKEGTFIRNYVKLKDIIRSFMKYGCDINSKDTNGDTVLHIAVNIPRDEQITHLLLQYGADINIENDNKETPVTCASQNNTRLVLRKHIERLKVINYDISQKNRSHYFSLRNVWSCFSSVLAKRLRMQENDDCACYGCANNEWIKSCKNECTKMKNIKINSYTTLYSILFKSTVEMTSLVKNNDFIEIVQSLSFSKNFPVYGYLIKLKFNQAIAEEPFIKSAKDSLQSLIDHKLPDACSENIMKYLKDKDIHKLADINNFT